MLLENGWQVFSWCLFAVSPAIYTSFLISWNPWWPYDWARGYWLRYDEKRRKLTNAKSQPISIPPLVLVFFWLLCAIMAGVMAYRVYTVSGFGSGGAIIMAIITSWILSQVWVPLYMTSDAACLNYYWVQIGAVISSLIAVIWTASEVSVVYGCLGIPFIIWTLCTFAKTYWEYGFRGCIINVDYEHRCS